MVLAEALLLQRHRRGTVIRMLMEPEERVDGKLTGKGGLGLTDRQARLILGKVEQEWREQGEEIRADARRSQILTLNNLYQTAFEERKLNVCVQIMGLLAKIQGTLAPLRLQVDQPLPGAGDDEYADRSISELNYFAEHGEWPAEGGRVH